MKKQPKARYSQQFEQLWFFLGIVLSGLAMGLPFFHYQLGWLSLICLLPLLWVLHSRLGRANSLGVIWLSGWLMMLSVVFWIIQTQPERWATLSGWWAIGALVLTYILFSGALSLGFLVVGWLYKRLKVDLLSARSLWLFPALWVVGEWSRSLLFSVISWGPNTTLGPHWNFGDLGFAASATPLVFASRFIGLYGLSFVVVLLNLVLFWLWHKQWKWPLGILGGVVLLSSLGWATYARANGETISVAALQLGHNESLQIGGVNYHDGLAELAPEQSVDVMVLSEYSDIFNESAKAQDVAAMQTIMRNGSAPIITSRERTVDTKRYNTLSVYQADGNLVYEHDKEFLIPIGEAMPYAYIYLFQLLNQKQAIEMNQQSREVSKGVSAETFQANGLRIGAMACSGAISPELYRDLVSDGASLLTNSASLSIFSEAPSYHQQAQQMARFMAVANARPVVQATDGSFSFIVDHNGSWLQKSNQRDMQLLQQEVALNNRRTIYTLLGEWVVVVSLVLVVVAGYKTYRKI